MHRTTGINYAIDSNGNRIFSDGPPGSTVKGDWLTSVQEEIANVIEQSGLQLYPDENSDVRTQLWEAVQRAISPYDVVITSQVQFEDIIERVGANNYQIKSEYTSVYIKNPGVGSYNAASSNILSGGDTWGYIQTNLCKHLECESGAVIGFGTTRGYIEVNTDDCYLKNVWVKGESGTTVASLSQSFLLNALRVTYDNCKISERKSSAAIAGFQGSGTVLHNMTSKYINCSSFTLRSSADHVYGFKDCMNLNGCLGYDLDSGSLDAHGFISCSQLSNCIATQIDGSGQHAYGYKTCDQVSSCRAEDIDSSNGDAIGFSGCDQVSGCKAVDVDTSTIAGTDAIGFYGCDQISGCIADDIDASALSQNAFGFHSCDQISGCKAINITSGGGVENGFRSCNYGSSLFTNEAANAGNDWIDTVDAQIVNKVSTPSIWT